MRTKSFTSHNWPLKKESNSTEQQKKNKFKNKTSLTENIEQDLTLQNKMQPNVQFHLKAESDEMN